ncbi:MAG: diaminopimelate dehydrogenase [Clostridiales bacterium]|nr:diaminopimelate dehydrogenase [Clostridiales bacterium]
MSIRIGIYGYGNLGRGVELAIGQNPDMTAVGVFTRRAPSTVKTCTGIPVYSASEADNMTDKIDVMILCGGSATDLPKQTPALAEKFNVVDSFDTHAKIPEHLTAVQAIAEKAGKTALISGGWDPGMFSLARLYGGAVLPNGKDYTFWGKGVSQGHSDAIRRIDGVVDAKQYTIPIDSALTAVRSGAMPNLATDEKHERECFVVAEEGADKARIEREIKTMPNYFADYKTTVHFISLEELREKHGGLPHGGQVIRCGQTGANGEHKHVVEYSLKLDSNAEFTASVLVACARAVYRMNQAGDVGCKTLFDIPPAYLSAKSREDLIKELL